MAAIDFSEGLSYYWSFAAPCDSHIDTVKGEEEGRNELPPTSQESLGSYELMIVHQAIQAISEYRARLSNRLSTVDGLHADLGERRNKQYDAERQRLSKQYDLDKDELERRIGPTSVLGVQQFRACHDVDMSLENLRSELGGREPLIRLVYPRWRWLTPYLLLLALLSLTELVINKGVFEDIFRAGAIFGYGGAGVMGLAVVFFGHLIGLFVRQCRVRRRPPERLRTWVGIPLILLLVTFSLYELSVIRQSYLTTSRTANPLVSSLSSAMNEVASGRGPLGSALRQVPLAGGAAQLGAAVLAPQNERNSFEAFQPLGAQGLLLLLLNLSVFLGGGLLSYIRHDPHPDYEPLLDKVNRCRRRIARRQERFDLAMRELDENYRRINDNLTRRADELARDLAEQKVNINGAEFRLDIEMENVAAVVAQRIHAYQRANTLARKTPAPLYFGESSAQQAWAMILGNRYQGGPA
ncbi:membrane protein of unknown function [Magnetospirillum sp. XM-1]|uniref:hypothetical protein n=1 Tax=Magnetospirillum sp. XM-1 TaxID=1663591 RepID=UPI00073E0222|nr:hypothetical protein [Magnetospirillum sp. XM-1]CUW38466.1 membrane protein of unknown function [Magnetospirillum sp. XM-1]